MIAGVFAAAFLLTTYQYVRDSMLGNSEALLAALFLWGFERHLDGRRDHALYLGLGAALLRPEVWPFLGLYGLWLFFRDPRMRLRLVLVALAIPLLWFGPELWGSGEPFRASSRATNPNPGSAAFADHPGLEVVRRFLARAVIPLQVATLVAAGYAALAWHRHRREGGHAVPVRHRRSPGSLLVAFMTELGLRGQPALPGGDHRRHLRPGWHRRGAHLHGHRVGGRRAGTSSARTGLRVASAVFVLGLIALSPVIKNKVDNVSATLDELRYEASLWHSLPGVIDRAGGPDKLLELRQRLLRPLPDPDGRLPAGRARDPGRERSACCPPPGSPSAPTRFPKGPLVAKLTDTPLPRGHARRALAGVDRATLGCARAVVSRGRRRCATREADCPHSRADVLALTIFS
ncbi:MAG: hypothetical protein WKF40_02445 [Thermoleophilaceae bacterium]